MSLYFLGNGGVTSSCKSPNYIKHLAETYCSFIILYKSQIIICFGWKNTSFHKPDTVWWGIWTIRKSLEAFTSVLGAVHGMDRFMERAWISHSLQTLTQFQSRGDLLAALWVTRPFSILTHLPVCFWQATGLWRPVKLVMVMFREYMQHIIHPFQCVKPYLRGVWKGKRN